VSTAVGAGGGTAVAPKPLRVLIVEDNPADAELAVRALTGQGLHPVVEVVDTEAAFTEALDRFDPEVIVSDFGIPGWSGEMALRLARRLAPQTPFVFLSGQIGEEAALELLREGAWDYVLKDRPARLGDAVRRALALVAENAALKTAEASSQAATTALAVNTERLRSAMDTFVDAIVILEAVRDDAGGVVDLVCVDANPEAVVLAGGDAVVGRSLREITASWSHASMCYAQCLRVLEVGAPATFEITTGHEEADRRVLDVHAARLGDGITLTYRDISLRRQAELLVEKQGQAFERIARGDTLDSIVTFVRANVKEILPGLRCTIRLEGDGTSSPMAADLPAGESSTAAVEARDPGSCTIPIAGAGDERLGELTLTSNPPRPLTAREEQVGRDAAHLVSVSVDRDRAQQQLRFLALHDPLTGLYNRLWILDILESDLALARRSGSAVAVFFLDLDNFKIVNDSLGHTVGDEVLVAVAGRISHALRPGDRVGRFGADEFIVIAPGTQGEIEAIAIAERLGAAVSQVGLAGGHSVTVSASIGIVLSDPTSTPMSLLRDTDSALVRAKAAGRSRWAFFDPEMHAEAMARLVTEAELRTAIGERQFVVHYQPIVSLPDATVAGYEALVRWNHPLRGLLAPAEFLQVAEDSGLVDEIDDQVLEQVFDLLQHRPDVTVAISVNNSPSQITRPGWHDRFLARIHARGIDPRRIVIEVTESAILSVLDRTREDLADLHDQGIGIHVDDFGTGYSSIALLRDLPVSGLKLDLTFTRQLTTDDTSRALAAGLAGLAHGLNIVSIAEGIETTEQADILRAQGWTHGQGYLYGRPGPIPAADGSITDLVNPHGTATHPPQ